MKVLYIECSMGNAGDMMMAALSELIPNPEEFITKMNDVVGSYGVHVKREPSTKCGILGSHIDVHIHGHEEQEESMDFGTHGHSHDNHGHSHEHNGYEHSHEHNEHSHEHSHTHSHSGLKDISEIIGKLNISEQVKNDAIAVYKIIAEAESTVHGKPVDEIHFHEVGNLDAITDIVGVCLLIEQLAPDKVMASPINTGSGHVHCAHGILPVPAPATAYILKDMPAYSNGIKGELCTPTGAALLKHFADKFGDRPVLKVKSIGYGMGKKDFKAANCVRVFLGEDEADIGGLKTNGEIAELKCNLDDMTGEAIGFATDILFQNGALDVFSIPIQMKKNRPGILLVCICEASVADKMAELIIKHTTTFGLRKTVCERYTLSRSFTKRETALGEIQVKTGTGYGVTKSKYEYEDISSIAKKNNISLQQVYERLSDQ